MALMKRRGRPAKAGSPTLARKSGFKMLECFFCHTPVKVDADTKAVLCSMDVLKLAGGVSAPKSPAQKAADAPVKLNKDGTPRKKRAPNGQGQKYVPSGRGKGWHLKAYFVDPKTGEQFAFGKPVKGAAATKAKKDAAKKAAAKAQKRPKGKRGRPRGR